MANVVVVMSDQHNYAFTSVAGHPFLQTPMKIRTGIGRRAVQFGPREDPFYEDTPWIGPALEWLGRGKRREPWTLLVGLKKPHRPMWVTQALWDMYPQGGDLPAFGMDCESARHPYAQDLRAHFETEGFTEEQIRGNRRGYLGCVTFVDTVLGQILDVLEATGQSENTNFIYTSDHGEMLGKFGLWWKSALYEDSAHVPLIAAGPDFGAGARVRTPVELLDLQAALFKATGAERPDTWRGTPLQEIPDDDPGRVAFSEYHGHGTRGSAFMVRKGDWKLIYYSEAPHQLFNLKTDPDELDNLYTREPLKAGEMEEELRKICSPEKENERAEAFIQGQLETLEAAGELPPG